ncbi:MAG: hypothetical protein KAY32_03805 [Candidatus Eisenbacteria sp.]|nr:hypothetical protein [Candidatus Eisenbacteria bacterium]
MTIEELWRTKTDEELLAASQRLSEFTEDSQRVIIAEVQRREDRTIAAERQDAAQQLSGGKTDSGQPALPVETPAKSRSGTSPRIAGGALVLPGHQVELAQIQRATECHFVRWSRIALGIALFPAWVLLVDPLLRKLLDIAYPTRQASSLLQFTTGENIVVGIMAVGGLLALIAAPILVVWGLLGSKGIKLHLKNRRALRIRLPNMEDRRWIIQILRRQSQDH